MSNTRYLEFDSTYRNRIQYPEPADFTVEMSQTGTKGQLDAADPISFGSPILWWNSSFIENGVNTSISLTNPCVDTSNATSSPTILIINGTGGELRVADGFYNGAILSLSDGTTTYRRRITDYKLISTTQAQVTVETAFPDPLSGYTSGTIQNPTGDTINDTVPKVFIPAGKSIDNFYVGYTIQQYTVASNVVSVQNEAVITAYDGTTHLASLDVNTVTVSWLGNYNFSLRKAVPLISTIDSNTNPVGNNGKSIQLNLTTSSGISDAYKNCFLRMVETSGGALPVASFSSTTVNAPFGEERRIVKYIAGSGTVVSANSAKTVITLDSNASQVEGFYVGAIITNTTRSISRTVLSYVGSDRQVTLDGALTGTVAGDAWIMRTAIIESGFSVAPATGAHAQTYELEYFTRDNAVPFAFTGSLTSTQEMVCYEVELLNLILPNSVLQSGRGGRPIFHPYMYVELQQVSASSAGNKNIICSNNPNSTRMLFRAVIDDTTQPVYSPFIKVDSDGMTHVIKFKPTDSFHFSVHHPGGDLFKTVATDTTGGTEPNPLVQISACFSFKRV